MKRLLLLTLAACIPLSSCTTQEIDQARHGLEVAGQLLDVLAPRQPTVSGKTVRNVLQP